MLSKKPLGKSNLVAKDRDDYTDKTSYGLPVGQIKAPSQSSGGSIENTLTSDGKATTLSIKNPPKNMRIRETPIRVRKGGVNKVILRKNSNGGEEIP